MTKEAKTYGTSDISLPLAVVIFVNFIKNLMGFFDMQLKTFTVGEFHQTTTVHFDNTFSSMDFSDIITSFEGSIVDLKLWVLVPLVRMRTSMSL